MRTAWKRVVVATGAAAACTLGVALPAHADTYRWYGHGGVSPNEHKVYVHDDASDGNAAYTDYHVYNGVTGAVSQHQVRRGSGAYQSAYWPAPNYIINYRVCVDDWGSNTCTSWRSADK